MRSVAELRHEMEGDGKDGNEVVDFDQLVRIFVDTDVDTHFIVSLARTSTVAELRELVKETHRHCYPDSGDVEVGKLAVPGGDYGYHLADFLLIGQVYDRYEGKVFAEVKEHDPASNSSPGLFRIPTLNFKASSTQKKVPLLAKQPFQNGEGIVSTNGSELGALLAVGSNACELIVPKLQKEEKDEDGDCVLGSQEPLEGLPRRSAVGCFERIDEEEDEKLVERPEAEVSLVPDVCVRADKIITHAVSSDIPGESRKRDAPECSERPSKIRRLTEPAPSKAPLEDDDPWTAAASLSHMNRSDDSDSNSSGSKRRKKKVSHIYDLRVSEGVHGVMCEVEDKDESRKKETDLVIGSGVGGSASGGLGVGREEFLPEDPGVLAALRLLGKKMRRLRQGKKPRKVKPELEKELDGEKTTEKKEKKGKKEKSLKQKELEQEMELDTEKVPEEVEEPEEVKEMVVKKDKKIKKENKEKKQKKESKKKNLKQKESQQEKVPEADEVRKDEQVPVEEEETTENKDKKNKQEQKEPEQEMEKEEPEEVEEMMGKKEKKSKKEKKEKKQKQKKPQQEKKLKKEKEPEEERMEKNERKHKKQEQIIEEITPLDCPSQNALLEESEKEPQQEDGQVGAAAVSPDPSDHAVHDEKDSDDDDVPGPEVRKGVLKKNRTVSDQDLGRADFLRDEVSESGTPQREAQVSGDTCEEGTTLNGGMVKGFDDKVLTPKINLFGDVNDMEISPSYQGGTDPSPQTQGTKTGSVKSQQSPNPSKHISYTGAGRGAPSQTRSTESSRDMTKGKQTGGRNSKANESQSSQCSEKATQQSEGINLDSEVSGAWLRRGLLDSEPGQIDQSQVAKPAHSRSSSGESSAESDPRFADHTEVSRKGDHVNHAVKNPEKHARTSAKRSDGGEVNVRNDSLEFFSQDQSFHVAPTQVQKALSGSTTEESSDESDNEDTDNLKKQTTGNVNKGGEESEESSDESGDSATPGRTSFPSLTTRTPLPTVSRMTGNGGSQSFKRRASGVAAEIEAKFAQFIESQGGLDEIMGITLGQRKRSMPVESSTQGAESLATPFGSPLDLALNTQESVKTSPIALDIAQASQSSAGKYSTPQFKVPKPVPVGTTSGAVQGVFSSAAPTATPLPGREVPKARTVKELRLKRKESTPKVDKKKESGGLVAKNNNASPLSALEPSKEPFAAEREAGNSSLLSTPKTPKGAFLVDPNAIKSSLLKSSENKKRREEKQHDSQFMIVNNTDHISEQEREEKKLGSEEDGSLKSGKKNKELKVNKELVETGVVVGSQEMFVLESSGKKKKRKISEKEGSRKKRMKFLPEDMDGKQVTVLPENSVERSARETEELYFKLEKAKKDLWLQNNSISSFRKEEERIRNRAADFDDTEGGEDVAQSRLVPEEPQIDEPIHIKLQPPSPVFCAGTTEASDREDFVFQSQDEKAETSQQRDKFMATDVFDYVSEDELPTRVLSKSAKKSETNERKKAMRMEELSDRAVQRVLEDEMLHVADGSDAPGKNSRKGAKPVKWTVRMRNLSPGALALSPHGGTIPSNFAIAEFRSSPKVVDEVAEPQVTTTPRVRRVRTTDESGGVLCPRGCGKSYSKKSSAFYVHRSICSGAPIER